MDVLSALKDFGIPVVGALAGFIATSYALRTEVKQLKTRVDDVVEAWKVKFAELKDDHEKDHNDHKEDLERKYKELKEQLEEIEENLHKWERESSHSFASDHEFNTFIQDQQRQWQAVQRTLGQIEGMLKKLPS